MGTNLRKLLKSSLGMRWRYCLFSENQNGTGEKARQLRPLAAIPGDRVWFPGSKRWLTIMSNSSSWGSDTPFWPLCMHVMHRHGCRHVPGMSPFSALIVSWDSFCCIKACLELLILLPLWPECWDIGIHHWCTDLFSLIFNSVLILGGLCVRRCPSDVGKTGAFLLWKYILKIQTSHNSLRSSCIYFEYLHHFAPPLQFFPRSGGNLFVCFQVWTLLLFCSSSKCRSEKPWRLQRRLKSKCWSNNTSRCGGRNRSGCREPGEPGRPPRSVGMCGNSWASPYWFTFVTVHVS